LVSVSVILASGLTALSLQVSINDPIIAQLSAPRSCPANNVFLRKAADRTLNRIGIELDVAVVEEAQEAVRVDLPFRPLC